VIEGAAKTGDREDYAVGIFAELGDIGGRPVVRFLCCAGVFEQVEDAVEADARGKG
jgi:hypothetical protein